MIDPQTIKINRRSIIKTIGLDNSHDIVFFEQLTDYLIEKCLEKSSPQACYRVIGDPVFIAGDWTLKLKNKIFNLNKMVYAAIKKSTMVAMFAGTCGPQIDEYSKNLMRNGDYPEGFIVDLIGSEIAESIAEIIHGKLEITMLESGLKVTNRYSPGYCNWNVIEQEILFSLLGRKPCNITLTNTSLMLPLKSVSGIIGVGAEVKKQDYDCWVCEDDNCLYRDKKR